MKKGYVMCYRGNNLYMMGSQHSVILPGNISILTHGKWTCEITGGNMATTYKASTIKRYFKFDQFVSCKHI